VTSPNVAPDLNNRLKKHPEALALRLPDNKADRLCVRDGLSRKRVEGVHLHIGGNVNEISTGTLETVHGFISVWLSIAVEIMAGTEGHSCQAWRRVRKENEDKRQDGSAFCKCDNSDIAFTGN